MMKKQQSMYEIKMTVSKDALSYRGFEIALRRYWGWYLLYIIIWVGGFILTSRWYGADSNPPIYWTSIGAVIGFIIFAIHYKLSTSRFYRKMKDKPQPIELGKLPHYWPKKEF